MHDNMENERGSLNDRIQGFNPEPRPEVLAELQKKLAKKERRRFPIWLFFALALLSGSLFVPFYIRQQNENSPEKTVAKINSGTNESEQIKLNERSKVEESASQESPSTKPNPSEKTNIRPKTSSEESALNQSSLQDKDNPSSPSNGSLGKKRDLKKESNALLAASDGIDQKSKVKQGSEIENTVVAKVTHAKKKRRNSKYSTPGKNLVAGLSNKKSYTNTEGKGGSLRHTSSSSLTQSPAIGTNNQSENAARISVSGEKGRNENPEILSREPIQNKEIQEKTPTTLPPVSNLEDQKSSETAATSETTAGAVKDNSTVNPTEKTPSADTLAQSKTPLVEPAGNDSTKETAKKSEQTDRKFSLTTLVASRYSAVRYLSINQDPSEKRNTLSDQNSGLPNRLAFELSNRLNYRFSEAFGFYASGNIGWNQEEIDMVTNDPVPSSFTKRVQGNSIVLEPVLTNQNEAIRATQLYVSTALGLQVQMGSALPTLRLGGGVQWALWSEVRRKLDGNLTSSGKMQNSGRAVPFVQASLAKVVKLGEKMRLSFEPMVQYQLEPSVRFKKGTNLRTFQVGFGVGIQW